MPRVGRRVLFCRVESVVSPFPLRPQQSRATRILPAPLSPVQKGCLRVSLCPWQGGGVCCAESATGNQPYDRTHEG